MIAVEIRMSRASGNPSRTSFVGWSSQLDAREIVRWYKYIPDEIVDADNIIYFTTFCRTVYLKH